MNTKNNLNRNMSRSTELLKFLRPTFAEAYEQSIQLNQQKEFLTFYSKNGTRTKITFREFSNLVENVRGKISAETAEDDVVICINENSIEALVYFTATLLEGRTLCPMNPLEGKNRIETRILRIGKKHKIYIGSNYSAELNFPHLIMQISTTHRGIKEISPPKIFQKNKPFILIFTSGTTGQSKIVQQLESAVILNVDALIERHEMNATIKIGTCLPIYHVNALEFSFFCTLLSGNELILFEDFNFLHVIESLKRKEFDVLSIVPSILHVIVKLFSKVNADDFNSLKYIVSAAAPISNSLAKDFFRTLPCKVLQGYGMSEAVNFSALNPIKLSDEEYEWSLFCAERPSVGTEIRGGEIYILNEAGNFLEEGVIGEIGLKGHHLMLGYVGESPETTFKDGIFRTGDLGFYKKNQDGLKFFFVTGRKKEIVKRMGITISLSEIEDMVSSYPNRTFDGIAVGFNNNLAGEEVAVIINGIKNKSELQAIADYMLNKLPKHLCPHLYISTEQKIRGASGKPKRGEFTNLLEEYKDHTFSTKYVLVNNE